MSSSVTGTPPAAVVMLYRSLRIVNACGIAAAGESCCAITCTSDNLTEMPLNITVMFVYDYILCTGREYQYVWQSHNSRASRLVYLYIRGGYLPYDPEPITALTGSPSSCIVLGWCTTALALLNLIGPAILTTIRTYVLSGRNKLLGGSALILSLGPFLVNVSSQYRYLPVNLPPPENCGVADTGSAAENIGTLLFGNLLDLILITLSITDTDNGENQVTQFLDPINSILSARFLLDLYETNARLERGGSSLSQSNIGTHSLHFAESGGARADAPENPPFLDSFSGPVLHPFPDDIIAFDTIDDKPKPAASLSVQTILMATTAETATGGSARASESVV
ncbi:hypothetical protein C2E23DRAFT_917821 [Lenzites betulinus]|nr:hypothetical protein C2E23DRAFT_917821 [Lenzites betulinus]